MPESANEWLESLEASTAATESKEVDVPETRDVQVIPSVEVRIVPPFPTVTSWEPACGELACRELVESVEPVQVTKFNWLVVPEMRDVHAAASGEVRMMPALVCVLTPTVTS